MPRLQEIIHKLEVGSGLRYLKTTLTILALLTLFVGYNWRSYRNLGTQEAMDAAQVARNLSEGKGYTTQFIRPLSLYLVGKKNLSRGDAVAGNDLSQIKSAHPDLANPPVYPSVLAAWMKIYPAALKGMDKVRDVMPGFIQKRLPSFQPTLDNPLWQNAGRFWWHPDDLFIALLNEGIFLLVIVLTFSLARQLFDVSVAWVSALLLLSCEMLWRFSVSGLSTMLLLLIFMGLIWCLVLAEREIRDPKGGSKRLFLLTAATGLAAGLGMLTRYSFGWVIVPLAFFFIFFGGPRRAVLCAILVGIFLISVSPWVYRNIKISGTPFGTATYALLEGPTMFPDNALERSLEPEFKKVFRGGLREFLQRSFQKFTANTRTALNDIPGLGGNWLTSLFLAGLLLGFRNPGIRRLRYFLMMCLATFVIVQAMGRTYLSENSPQINSENLFVLLVPLVFVFAVSLFYLMLDQMSLAFNELRYVVVGVFVFIMSLPMIFSFLPPKPSPLVYPPYYPPLIRQVSELMKENELMMSDIPWAVAWYGRRQCVWLTLDAVPSAEDSEVSETFFEMNLNHRDVRAIYLTSVTMDTPFASNWVRPSERSWNRFISRGGYLPPFPLRESLPGLGSQQLFLTDSQRWKTASGLPVKSPPTSGSETNSPAKP